MSIREQLGQLQIPDDYEPLLVRRLREFFGTEDIVRILEILNTTCLECWDAPSRCRCWDDD